MKKVTCLRPGTYTRVIAVDSNNISITYNLFHNGIRLSILSKAKHIIGFYIRFVNRI